MDYQASILDFLIQTYEKRGLYDPENRENRQGIFLDVPKIFPEYLSIYNENYQNINAVLDRLVQQGILTGEKDPRGYYGKLRLNLEKVPLCYELSSQTPLGDVRNALSRLLRQWDTEGIPLLQQFRSEQLGRLENHKPLEFGIADNISKLQDVLRALSVIVHLESETYIRNFSEAVFSDSKRFQTIRNSIEGILCRYGGQELQRKTILESFNLLNNPVYLLLKGRLTLSFGTQSIDVSTIPGGIALPPSAIPAITGAILHGSTLVTVENLTTFHDENESENAVVYLGGFQNSIRTSLLKRIYAQNQEKSYYHKGDLDVYGFLILENLKSKTGIPFKPIEMDLKTLKQYESHGLIKPLSAEDRKRIHLPQLDLYRDVLDYMEKHNCKAEQESRQALFLLKASNNILY